jgi:uncharacterized cupin superfamily protein
MPHTQVRDLPWQEQRSPGGKFRSFARNISLALGGIANTGPFGGGHPFDVQIRRVPAGAAICPFHAHFNQWEFFLVESGTGVVRAGADTRQVGPGDFFIHPPGEPHQLTAGPDGELTVLIVADNAALDACYYPDSNKWGLRPPGKFFRMEERPYFDGEEPAIANAPEYRPTPPPRAAALTPFADRIRNISDVAWDPWRSPRARFSVEFKGLSLAVGEKEKTPVGLGGHPFDVELNRLAPGATAFPLHFHAAQWEFFYIAAGAATIRTQDGTFTAPAGTAVMHPPREAHQISNRTTEEVLYYLVADNPPVDYWYFPDSNKWGLPDPRTYFRPEPLEYLDGEE